MLFLDLAVIEGQMSNATLYDHWTPPEPEPPVIISDNKYTTTPLTDENLLPQCILELAHATRTALDLDFDENKRYCRRLRLDHLNDRGDREILPVLLPYEAFCWNSYDAEDIVILMLEAIKEVDYQNIVWFQVRALLDDFMDPLVYRFIEVLEKSESADDVDFEKVEKRFCKAQQIHGQSPRVARKQQSIIHAEPTHSKVPNEPLEPRQKTSDVALGPRVINLADEDDDCIIID